MACAGHTWTHSPQPLQAAVFILTWLKPPTINLKSMADASQTSPHDRHTMPCSAKHWWSICARWCHGDAWLNWVSDMAGSGQACTQASQKSQPWRKKLSSGKPPASAFEPLTIRFDGQASAHLKQRLHASVNCASSIDHGGRIGRSPLNCPCKNCFRFIACTFKLPSCYWLTSRFLMVSRTY